MSRKIPTRRPLIGAVRTRGGRRPSIAIAAAARTAALALLVAAVAGACGDEPVRLPQPMADNPPIDYPVELWDAEIGGETLLTVHIDAEGLVDSVRVEETSGSPQLDSAAVRGGRQMRFTPGRRGDRRVGAWVRIPVRFQRDSVDTRTAASPAMEGDGFNE